MAERPQAPGLDQIAVAVAPGRCLCNSREHARLGCLAEVIVTFGQLGIRWQAEALWPECWGRSYALCGECWDTVRQIAARRRPALVITEAISPPSQFQAPPGPRTAPAGSPVPGGDRGGRAPLAGG
jgi:hypothetical protein